MRALLDAQHVVMHPLVLGELACGNMPNRGQVLADLKKLPWSQIATDDEVLYYIELRSLMGKGIGFIDVHLLASAAMSDDVRLWTRDGPLRSVAADLGVSYDHP